MKKKLLMLLLAATMSLAIVGCESSDKKAVTIKETETTDEAEDNNNDEAIADEEDDDAADKDDDANIDDDAEDAADSDEPTSEVGKRSNPVPLGSTATFENNYYSDDGEIEATVSVTFSNVIRGEEAYNYLQEANQYNAEAPDGQEWMIFDVELTLDEGSDDDSYYVMPSFKVIDSAGSEVEQAEYATFADADDFGYVDLYKGGTATGKIGKLVPSGDDEVLIEFSDWNSSVFFALK